MIVKKNIEAIANNALALSDSYLKLTEKLDIPESDIEYLMALDFVKEYYMPVYYADNYRTSYSSLENISDEVERIADDVGITDKNLLYKLGLDENSEYNPKMILSINDELPLMFKNSLNLSIYATAYEYDNGMYEKMIALLEKVKPNYIDTNNKPSELDIYNWCEEFIEFLDQVSMRTIHY